MIATTLRKSFSVRPQPTRYALLILAGLTMPFQVQARAGHLNPPMLYVVIAMGIAICLATAFHWYRSQLEIGPEGVRNTSWKTYFLSMSDLRKIKVATKAGALSLSFFTRESDSPLFSISSHWYGTEGISRIIEHIQALNSNVKVVGYKSRQDLEKRE